MLCEMARTDSYRRVFVMKSSAGAGGISLLGHWHTILLILMRRMRLEEISVSAEEASEVLAMAIPERPCVLAFENGPGVTIVKTFENTEKAMQFAQFIASPHSGEPQ